MNPLNPSLEAGFGGVEVFRKRAMQAADEQKQSVFALLVFGLAPRRLANENDGTGSPKSRALPHGRATETRG